MKILFATDLKEPKEITSRIEKLSDRLDAELYVLHVHVPTPTAPLAVDPMSGFGDMAYAIYDPSIEESMVAAERTEFDRFLSARFCCQLRPALRQGDPAQVILDEAEELSVDVIVLGKRRHSAIQRMLLGSVTHAVSRESTNPVLLMPINEN